MEQRRIGKLVMAIQAVEAMLRLPVGAKIVTANTSPCSRYLEIHLEGGDIRPLNLGDSVPTYHGSLTPDQTHMKLTLPGIGALRPPAKVKQKAKKTKRR